MKYTVLSVNLLGVSKALSLSLLNIDLIVSLFVAGSLTVVVVELRVVVGEGGLWVSVVRLRSVMSADVELAGD